MSDPQPIPIETRPTAEGEAPGMNFTMHGVLVMTITEDGRIITGPLFAHADHASVTFLMALTDIAPSFLQRIKAEAFAWQRRAIDAEAELARIKDKLN